MAKEDEFKFHSATVGADAGINANFDLTTGDGFAQQDISQYIKHAELEREKQATFGARKDGYRKMATIPDIVALKILQEHHLDLHDPMFMHDPNNMKRLRHILMTEYRDLLINT